MRSVVTCGACRRGRSFLFVLVLCSVVGMSGSAVLADLLQNGDFSDGLNYWYYEDGVQLADENGNKLAVFSQNGQTFPYLSQVFTIPKGSVSLSFDYQYERHVGAGVETFTAWLYDSESGMPIVPTHDVYPDDGITLGDWFFGDDYPEENPTNNVMDPSRLHILGLGEGWNRVILDLEGASAEAAVLAFDFPGLGNVGSTGEIRLDNVSLVVPAPPAVVLFVLGMGTACTMLRRRMSPAA